MAIDVAELTTRPLDPAIEPTSSTQFEDGVRRVPRGRARRGRLPGLPPEPGHLRPAPGRHQPDGAGEGPLRPGRRPSSSRCSATSPTTYSRGWGHLTTRQNVQFHFVAARAGPRGAAPARLGRADEPRGVRRHRPQRRRAATSPARARSRCSTSRPWAEAATELLPAQPATPSACPASSRSTSPAAPPTAARRCSTTSASIAVNRPRADGTLEPGFQVFIAGGLGANPHPAQALEEFTSREDLHADDRGVPARRSTTTATATTSCGPA